jgi:6,7-dimethyl-8-ribityllumazine synthase
MSSSHKNLSEFNSADIPNGKNMSIAIVVSEWNDEITNALFDGTYKALVENGVKPEKITRNNVPGSFELTLGAKWMAEKPEVDAVICLGCVIQGETKHFDFICQAVANGITDLNIAYGKPIIFGVLTTNNLQQAKERAGGKYGNKGVEAAITALKMVALKK